MNVRIGSNHFDDVAVPVLWGTRAILQDHDNRLSIVDVGADEPDVEVIGDAPAPGVRARPVIDGFSVMRGEEELYRYCPTDKTVVGTGLALPEIQIETWRIRVGANTFQNNSVVGFGVGILVTEDGIVFGAPLPDVLSGILV